MLAGWSGKEQSLEFFFQTTVSTHVTPQAFLSLGLSSKGAVLSCDLGLLLGRSPPFSGKTAGHVSMAQSWLAPANTRDLWNLPWLSHWVIPSHLSAQSGTWRPLPRQNAGLGGCAGSRSLQEPNSKYGPDGLPRPRHPSPGYSYHPCLIGEEEIQSVEKAQ